MATLSTNVITRAGLVNTTYAACTAGGDRFTPGPYTTIHVKNGGGSPQTVTVAATGKVYGDLAAGSKTMTVPAGQDGRLGPFPPDQFVAADGSGLTDITYTGVTSLTIAVYAVQVP